MDAVSLIGIDLGKHFFHVHGQDRQGRALLRKKCSREQLMVFFANFQRCTVAMAACAGGASHGTAACRFRPRSQADLAAVRQAFRQGQQERFHRRRSDLRSGITSFDGLCDAQDGRKADTQRPAPG
jgi:transposase